ncbi:hypothetical protein GCM10023093_01310 [Nemorincola caseinilytica]|uniref:Thioredoxin domain-containing protein n=1 Tax=Nemorincola caseinilytica TaxID=2054315 RepID=A0ABP8N4K5_9BACT
MAVLLSLPALSQAQQDVKTTQNNPQPNIDYKQPGAPLPPFIVMAYNDTSAKGKENLKKKERRRSAKNVDSTGGTYTVLTEKDLDNGANLLVMMFNPTCLHCEDVTFMMEKNISDFKRSKVVLVASKPMAEYLPDFAQRHHIASYPAMYIGWDSSRIIDNVYLYQALPQINIYDGKRNLLKTYTGEVPIDTLRKYIE